MYWPILTRTVSLSVEASMALWISVKSVPPLGSTVSVAAETEGEKRTTTTRMVGARRRIIPTGCGGLGKWPRRSCYQPLGAWPTIL